MTVRVAPPCHYRLWRGVAVSDDPAALAAQISPYLTAAVGAYGGAVLADVRDQAASATVALGRRILRRIFGHRDQDDLPVAVAELVAAPQDGDLQAALRAEIRRALAADDGLVLELREMLADAPAITVNGTAQGARSVAAGTIIGPVFNGDAYPRAETGGVAIGQAGVVNNLQEPPDPH
jgi:hypothetical protein